MIQFDNWCASADTQIGAHHLRIVTADPSRRDLGIGVTAAGVPGHYAAEEHVAQLLVRLGKARAAAFIEGKLPTTKQIRSGDLGEIYATEWIADYAGYQVPIKRLRWKNRRSVLILVAISPSVNSFAVLRSPTSALASAGGISRSGISATGTAIAQPVLRWRMRLYRTTRRR
jgi:hypothetical protein